MSNINFIGVGKYRLIDGQGMEFESFHDINVALKTWFNPIFANIHMGGVYTIKLKDNSEKEEYKYILEFTPLTDRPIVSISGGDIVMNFEDIYDREPTIKEYLVLRDKFSNVYSDYDYSEQNNEITDIIRGMIEREELSAPPEEVDE